MKRLADIHGAYGQIDTQLENERRVVAADAGRLKQIEQRQQINDHAYFVLCWGQLESELDDSCRDAIRKRKSNPDWTKRRAWDLYDPDDKRLSGLSFEERVSLVLDRQDSKWKQVMTYYALRNQIAHGGSYAKRIQLKTVIEHFYQIQSKISK